jgi:hypothetical protein
VTALDIAKRAVIRVGGGRGFIASAGGERKIVTAAHCLPFDRLPTPHLSNSVCELTFRRIIGRLTAKRLTIWGELCAYSLTDDFAVLSEPDGECGEKHCMRYENFTQQAMPIGQSPDAVAPHLWLTQAGSPAWTLSLTGEWQKCIVYNGGRFLTLDADAKIESGMSGSPIINEKGAAVGVISTGSSGVGENHHPSLSDCLPPWLMRKLDVE